MTIDLEFPGGMQVAARFKGFTVLTDQTREHGGTGAAPEPFDLFLASLGACAGFYALRFCQERAIATRGLALTLATERDPEGQRLREIRFELTLPDGFPDRYRAAILRAVDQCAVKRQLADPPRFAVGIAARGAACVA